MSGHGECQRKQCETLYRMLDGKVEAMEFVVRPGSTNIVGVPRQQLGLKKEAAGMQHQPPGQNHHPHRAGYHSGGDIVVVVTTHKGIRDLSDIVRY